MGHWTSCDIRTDALSKIYIAFIPIDFSHCFLTLEVGIQVFYKVVWCHIDVDIDCQFNFSSR